MNRVTRISSAAFGMLLLAGLAVYQGDGPRVTVEDGSLAGTALAKKPEKSDINCEDTAGLSEQDQKFCAGEDHSKKPNQH